MDAVRGLVRPLVTLGAVFAFFGVVGYLAVVGQVDRIKPFVEATGPYVGVIVTFWFATRSADKIVAAPRGGEPSE